MPFYKWIIATSECSNSDSTDDLKQRYSDLKETKNDATHVANKRMVNAMRQLSQLVQVADDIFTAIHEDCRIVFERTEKLGIKIKLCREIVDKLDAKTIPVPEGNLSGEQATTVPYVSCHAHRSCTLLSPSSRPPALDRLHRSAEGPSSPVFIPQCKVAKTPDGRPESAASSSITHIYCQPFRPGSNCSSLSSAETLSGKVLDSSEKHMTSSTEIPSAIVPIDVSGQPFSRMSTFRRSLIHVDFLIRRKKKKDKRRNTVAEGETKELKEVLQKIAIENQLTTSKSSNTSHNSPVEHCSSNNHEISIEKIDTNISFSKETNNNFINKSSLKSPQNSAIHKDCNGSTDQDSDNELTLKKKQTSESMQNASSLNMKKKPRSHLPISTSSAAMTVAVKMRQTHNNTRYEDGQSSSGNWSCSSERTSSDSDQQKSSHMDNRCGSLSPLTNSEDSLLTDNNLSRRKQCNSTSVSATLEHCEKKKVLPVRQDKDDMEISSCDSSECTKKFNDDDGTSTTASVDTDAIFISSGESDDELSDLSFFQEKFGSSASLSTISNGSLNSLLSRTGTEMSSSTGTLTSICQEPLPTPPPPPKIYATVHMENISENISLSDAKKLKENCKSKLLKSPEKILSKKNKAMPIDLCKTEQGNSKNIFTSLVNKKTQKANYNVKPKLKENGKTKKIKKVDTPLQFDMYGNRSPRKIKQVPIFIKENVSPIIEKSPKHHLQSFCPDNNSTVAKQEKDTFSKNSNENCEINPPLMQSKISCSSPVYSSTGSQSPDVFSDVSAKSINEEIAVPLKYGHQITVTPVRRHASIENYNGIYNSHLPVEKHHCPVINDTTCDSSHIRSNSTNMGRVFEKYPNKIIPSGYSTTNAGTRPQRPVTLLPPEALKPVARVVLDPEGRVIYSTNSLDRRSYNVHQTENFNHSNKNVDHQNHITHAVTHQKPCAIKYNTQHHSGHSPVNSFHANDPGMTPIPNCSTFKLTHNYGQRRYSDSHSPQYTYDTSPVVAEFYPVHEVLPSRENSVKIIYTTEERQSPIGNSAGNFNRKYNLTPINSPNPSPPDPNISGLPPSKSMLTQQNVSLHSQKLEGLSMPSHEKSFNSSSSECSYLLTSPPQLCNSRNGTLNRDIKASNQSSMSTEDLFAVIHNCKKRLNIKTDSDLSLASSSSRSSSPSFLSQSQSKGCLAETGFLSPRNSYVQCDSSRDRRSWADFRSPPGSGSERKSLASDRLGPTKPTSMHDFKMLLLQAKTSSQTNGPRKSAVEMLKLPVSQPNSLGLNSSPLNLSPRNSISFSTQNSPTSEPFLYNGHSTVPFKRGNRARASLQPRYIMYPPIFEDCSEETENGREMNAEELTKNRQLKHDGNFSYCTKNNIGTSSMWV